MTQDEKYNNPLHVDAGGYKKTLDYKEAFKKSYNEATEEDKQKIFNLPNFDAGKFFEISGIKVPDRATDIAKRKEALFKEANKLIAEANQIGK